MLCAGLRPKQEPEGGLRLDSSLRRSFKSFSRPSVASPALHHPPCSSSSLRPSPPFPPPFPFPPSHRDPGPQASSLPSVSIPFSLLYWSGRGDTGTGSSWSSPAVHDGGASPGGVVQPLPEHLPEGQQGVWGVGHAVVRPGHVVELSHRQGLLLLHLDGGRWEEGELRTGEGSWPRTGRGVGASLGHPVVPGSCGEGTSWNALSGAGIEVTGVGDSRVAASGLGLSSSPSPSPPPRSPAGARGCRAGHPGASNAHTSPGRGPQGQGTGQ